mmetsp:Transcript_16755/g.30452  ORF Transcript_16755/g.30452 Transcript_16755/m.30452 type:complete len:136 (-) Transcript_16755:289-696(-)
MRMATTCMGTVKRVDFLFARTMNVFATIARIEETSFGRIDSLTFTLITNAFCAIRKAGSMTVDAVAVLLDVGVVAKNAVSWTIETTLVGVKYTKHVLDKSSYLPYDIAKSDHINILRTSNRKDLNDFCIVAFIHT